MVTILCPRRGQRVLGISSTLFMARLSKHQRRRGRWQQAPGKMACCPKLVAKDRSFVSHLVGISFIDSYITFCLIPASQWILPSSELAGLGLMKDNSQLRGLAGPQSSFPTALWDRGLMRY